MGGIAGIASGTAITNCLSAATISTSGTGTAYTGSLCGQAINDCTVTNCWYDSTVCALGAVEGKEHPEVTGISTELMAMGGAAHALGFGQTLGTDTYPSYGDDPVYQVTTGCCTYSNTKPENVTEKAHVGGPCTGETSCVDCGMTFDGSQGHSFVDGICTVCGAADPNYGVVTKPTLTLKYPSLSFEAEILYNVYFVAENIDDVVQMGLVTFDTEVADGTVENATDVIAGFVTDGALWKVGTNGISAKNLGDTLYFRVYAQLTDGTYVYSDMKSYSAVIYANTILDRSTSSQRMKSLVVAMLNYGTEAQLYFGHNVDSLMNAGLSLEQLALVDAYDERMIDPVVAVDSTKAKDFVYDGSSFTRRAPTVSFDGAFAINYYFTAANAPDGGMTLYYWNIDDYNAAATLTLDSATGSMEMVATENDNEFWGQVPGIAAKELDQTVFVVGVYEYDGVTYTTGVLNYSIGKYCEGLAAKETSDQRSFAEATAVYGYYAKEYFSNL